MTPQQRAGVAVAAIGAGLAAVFLLSRQSSAAAGNGGVAMTGVTTYPGAPVPVPGTVTGGDTTRGDPTVQAYQQSLADLGYDPGPIDGRYGPLTANAVRDFQSANGLTVDGILGPRTKAAIDAALGVAPVPTSGLTTGSRGRSGRWERY